MQLHAPCTLPLPLPLPASSLFLQLANRLSDFPVPPWRVPEHINRADDAIMLADLHKPLPSNFFVVAERVGQRAGFAFASSRTDYFTGKHQLFASCLFDLTDTLFFFAGERHAHVETMAVDERHEGCGVAKALLAACEEWGFRRGDRFVTLNVWSQNTRARGV